MIDDLTMGQSMAIRFELRPFRRGARELMPPAGSSSLADLAAAFELESGFTPAGGYAGLVLEHYQLGDLTQYLAGKQLPGLANRCHCSAVSAASGAAGR